MARKYARKTKTASRRYRRRPKKSMWKVAKAAARSVIQKEAEPKYTRKDFGIYNRVSGLWTTTLPLAQGVDNGFFDPNVIHTSIPANNSDMIQPGTREDDQIMIKGVRVQLRVNMPKDVTNGKGVVYFGYDTSARSRTGASVISPGDFPSCDNFYMVRNSPAVKTVQKDLKILKSAKFSWVAKPSVINAATSQIFKDVDFYWKPKKPFPLKYDGPTQNELLNRQFFLCIKVSHNPSITSQPTMPDFGGVITTYYRDL